MSGTDTRLERRLTETLRAKAAQVPDVAETFDPVVAMLGESTPRRPRARTLVLAAMLVVVVGALGLAFALRDQDRAGTDREPAGPPAGPPVARIEIQALPTLSFQATDFTTTAGINEIDYISKGGTHQLVFADPSLSYFELTVPAGPTRGKVELQAGRDYTIYCSIPGHRAAGMQAVIHVAATEPAKTTG